MVSDVTLRHTAVTPKQMGKGQPIQEARSLRDGEVLIGESWGGGSCGIQRSCEHVVVLLCGVGRAMRQEKALARGRKASVDFW